MKSVKRKVTTDIESETSPVFSDNEQLNESIRLQGIVKVQVEEIDPITGLVTKKYMHHKNNRVVDLGKEVLCNLITAPQTNSHITTLKLGCKGHDLTDTSPNALLVPIEPLATDSSLIDTETVFSKDFDMHTMYPTDDTKTEVQFSVVLEPTEANSSDETAVNGAIAYTEAGMYTKGGVLFARETFPAIVKTENRRITFTWSILF